MFARPPLPETSRPLRPRNPPTTTTGAGVLAFSGDSTLKSTYQDPPSEANYDLSTAYNAQRAARAYLLRVVAVVLFAAGALSVAAFLSATSAADKWASALGAVINLIAAWHYTQLATMREHDGTKTVTQLELRGDEGRLETQAGPEKSAALEFYADGLRFCDWTVTMPLLVMKLYAIIGREYNGQEAGAPYNGVFLAAESAAAVAALMIILGAFVRLGTDDLADWRVGTGWWACGTCDYGTCRGQALFVLCGVVALLGSLACFAVLQYEMFTASYGMPDRRLLVSFFAIWFGYPVVFILSMALRDSSSRHEQAHAFRPELSVAKDVAYGLLDIWAKAVFAFWTVHTVFDRAFMDAPKATAHAW